MAMTTMEKKKRLERMEEKEKRKKADRRSGGERSSSFCCCCRRRYSLRSFLSLPRRFRLRSFFRSSPSLSPPPSSFSSTSLVVSTVDTAKLFFAWPRRSRPRLWLMTWRPWQPSFVGGGAAPGGFAAGFGGAGTGAACAAGPGRACTPRHPKVPPLRLASFALLMMTVVVLMVMMVMVMQTWRGRPPSRGVARAWPRGPAPRFA